VPLNRLVDTTEQYFTFLQPAQTESASPLFEERLPQLEHLGPPLLSFSGSVATTSNMLSTYGIGNDGEIATLTAGFENEFQPGHRR
jgi:hypothetical protein